MATTPTLFVRYQPEWAQTGYHAVLEGAENPLHYLSFGLLSLTPGAPEATLNTGPNEAALVILSGSVQVRTGDREWGPLGGRRSVFDGPGTSMYVGRESTAAVVAVGGPAEVAVCRSAAATSHPPFVVEPAEVKVVTRGQDHWRREVRDILADNAEGRVDRLVVGETINQAGEWSGYPPHKHDTLQPGEEEIFEELYHFRVDPPKGFGVQVHYRSKFEPDGAHLVRNGDSFGIPDGYHPVVAGGGYRVYYLWFMAGPGSRTLRPFEDPDHRWVARR